jgi:hypothetical protein
MLQKEIIFKKLSFVIGVILLMSFVTGTEVPLPLRSEIRLDQTWGCWVSASSHLIIKQEGSEIRILTSGSLKIKEGIIPYSDFKIFWDSLHYLNYWQLKERYEGVSGRTDRIEGFLSISFENLENVKKTKKIEFSDPLTCPVEFKEVYVLLKNMERFAQMLDWKTLLKYAETETREDELSQKFSFNIIAKLAISAIEDDKNLDTLLLLLPQKRKFAAAIIYAIKNIDDKKAIPVLHQFLEQLELEGSSGENDTLITLALQALVAFGQKEEIKILKKYLSSKYSPMIRTEASIILTKFNDYSGIPILIDYIKENKLSYDEFRILTDFCYKNKRVINALIKDLEVEAKKRELNDKIIVGLISSLSKITDQNYLYNPSDPLEVKKKIINKWFDWWKANKVKFK